MESSRKLTLLPTPEPLEALAEDVRLTGEAAKLAEQTNLRALEAAIAAWAV
jgi:hypothetical protein